MKYVGSCHCGNIKFEVEGTIDSAMACNCSMCQRKGSLLWFVPRDKLQVACNEANVRTYLFNKHVVQHRFCRVCGIHPYAEGKDPKGNPMAAINIRCIENIALDTVPVKYFDGRSK